MQIGPISFGITQKDVTTANKLRESSKFVSPSVAANQDFDRITHAAVHKDEWNLQEMYYHRISHTEPNICRSKENLSNLVCFIIFPIFVSN